MKRLNLLVVLFVFPILLANLATAQMHESIGIKDCIDKVTNLIPGDVIKVEKKFVSNKNLWELKSITENGSEVIFKIDLDDGKWLHIVSSDGPFDYDFTPNEGHISLQTAKDIVEESLGMKVLKWEYKLNKDKWEYGFWFLVKTGVPRLKVDPETGKIITKSRGR